MRNHNQSQYQYLTNHNCCRWADSELIRNSVGKVTNIIDGNYGIAVVRMRSRVHAHVRERAIVLFDTCDVWLGLQTAQQMVRITDIFD